MSNAAAPRRTAYLLLLALAVGAGPAVGATTEALTCEPGVSVALPAPAQSGGLPLLDALARRQSGREFAPGALPLQVLSDLLWAANGVNRPAEGKRTAATARNWQNLEVFVFTEGGVFRHDAVAHALVGVKAGDHRAATGTQPFVATAPVNLVYVADAAKMPGNVAEADAFRYDGVHAGIVVQNVYLYAASSGLTTVVRALVDRAAVAELLGLPASQRVVLAQTVGYPAR